VLYFLVLSLSRLKSGFLLSGRICLPHDWFFRFVLNRCAGCLKDFEPSQKPQWWLCEETFCQRKKTAENKEEVLVRLFKYPIHHHVDLNPKICFGECPQVTFEGVSLGFPYLILAPWPVIDFLLETAQLDHGF